MGIEIKYNGSSNDVNKRMMKDMEKAVIDSTNEFMDEMYDEVRKTTPVDSGRARAGWKKEKVKEIGGEAEVSNDVEYVTYLENGTRDTRPLRFVKKAVAKVTRKNK